VLIAAGCRLSAAAFLAPARSPNKPDTERYL
jgi:hypothetical protein